MSNITSLEAASRFPGRQALVAVWRWQHAQSWMRGKRSASCHRQGTPPGSLTGSTEGPAPGPRTAKEDLRDTMLDRHMQVRRGFRVLLTARETLKRNI